MVKSWVEKRILEIASLQRGFDLPTSQIEQGKFPIVYSNGIGENHKIAMAKGPGVITGRSGTIGRLTFIENDYFPHNTTLWVTNFNSNDEKFIYYLFHLIDWCRYATGSGVPTLNRNDIHELKLSLPSDLNEQRVIASALSDTDAYIDTLEKLIAKKRAIKQGVMQELLTGKRRLPGFNGKWEEKNFSEIFIHCPSKKHQILSSEYCNCGKYPVIDQGKEKIIAYSNNNEKVFSCPLSGIILFGDHTREIKYINFNFIIGADGTQIFYSQCFETKYLYYYLLNSQIPNTGYNRHFKFIKEMLFYISNNIDEQIAIATVLSDMDAEIDTLTTKLNKIKNIKQGMMSELLTGRIRLVEKAEVTTKKTAKIIEFPKAKQMKKGHNQQFDDAVAFGVIVDKFYNPKYLLGRVKMYKLLYLLRRYQEVKVSDFTKKAAGPYKSDARYAGGEKIAQESCYIVETKGKIGFSITKGEKISNAIKYADDWHWQESLNWLVSKFLYKSRDELETLATVDMAVCELQGTGKEICLNTVKDIISYNSEWKPKLSKPHFSDTNIKIAIKWRDELFGKGDVK